MQIFLLMSANAEELPTTRYLIEPNISYLKGWFSKRVKIKKKLDYSEGHNFICKKLVVATYAAKLSKTIQFIKTQYSYLREVVFEKRQKYGSNIPPWFS